MVPADAASAVINVASATKVANAIWLTSLFISLSICLVRPSLRLFAVFDLHHDSTRSDAADGRLMRADSAILRRLIRMTCWFAPLILRLGERNA